MSMVDRIIITGLFCLIFTMVIFCSVPYSPLEAREINKQPIKKYTHKSPKNPIQNQLEKADRLSNNDLWQHVIDELTFNIMPTPRLQKRVKWYLKQPDYLLTVNQRAEPYLFHLYQRIKRKGLPMDLILLPFVESDFRPTVSSSQNAVGIWQLMESTAYHFGVTRNEWYDGRQDVLASTDAALDYLVYLYRRFNGDWLLALAAYNSGEGRVKTAIRKSKQQGKKGYFWQLKLPKETAEYVPKLLALSYLLQVKHPDFKVPTLPNYALTSEVDFEQPFDFSVIASLTGVSKSQLHQLNPGFLQHQSAPQGPHKLLLPFTEKKLWETEFFNKHFSQNYTVAKSDTFFGLARRFNTSINSLMTLNKKRNSFLQIGEVLKINKVKPLSDLTLDYQVSPYLAQEEKQPDLTIEHEYKIKQGDSLWEISKQFNVPVKDLLTWNNLSSRSLLKPGTILLIHLPVSSSSRENQPKPKPLLLELEQLVKPNT